MDLQVLATLEQKTVSLSAQRRDTAAEYCHWGLECLIEARAEGFQDRDLLAEACEHLLEAIRHNRHETDAYLGMGYLLWLIGEYAEAIPYLSEALALAPGHPDAVTLLGLVQQPGVTPARVGASTPAFVQPELPDIDYDQLYDALEIRIAREVQQASALPPAWLAITSRRTSIEATESSYAELHAAHTQILAQIEQIEAEIDCSALRQMLRPLEVLLQRCRTSLTRSWQLIELEEMLSLHHSWLDSVLAYCEAGDGSLPQDFSTRRFDYLLGDCDALADQLDELEGRQLDIRSLITAYEGLAAKVAQLQDLLDQL